MDPHPTPSLTIEGGQYTGTPMNYTLLGSPTGFHPPIGESGGGGNARGEAAYARIGRSEV
jgi:hypothetical protein